jgi:hypothetical protein
MRKRFKTKFFISAKDYINAKPENPNQFKSKKRFRLKKKRVPFSFR